MLDHVSIQCADVALSAQFYDAVLIGLGAGRVMDFGSVIGYGAQGKASFWLSPLAGGAPNRELHIAFRAEDRAAVQNFFQKAQTGFGAVMNGAINDIISQNTSEKSDFEDESTSLGDQITTMQTQLANEQQTLETEFTAMESLEAQYQSEESTLSSLYSGSGSSTSSSTTTSANAAASAVSTDTSGSSSSTSGTTSTGTTS